MNNRTLSLPGSVPAHCHGRIMCRYITKSYQSTDTLPGYSNVRSSSQRQFNVRVRCKTITMKFVIVTLQRRAPYTVIGRQRKRTLPRLFNVPGHRHAVALDPGPILGPAPSPCRHRVLCYVAEPQQWNLPLRWRGVLFIARCWR